MKQSPAPEQAQSGRGGCWTLSAVRATPGPRVTSSGHWPIKQCLCLNMQGTLGMIVSQCYGWHEWPKLMLLSAGSLQCSLAMSSLQITWPLGSSGPMWPYIYLPDFLAGLGRRSHFSASEITWGSCCSPPTWFLYDIKLKVCAIYPEVWGCLGYIACWHSIEKCVG